MAENHEQKEFAPEPLQMPKQRASLSKNSKSNPIG
jgi:hypothetical protein